MKRKIKITWMDNGTIKSVKFWMENGWANFQNDCSLNGIYSVDFILKIDIDLEPVNSSDIQDNTQES